MSTIEERAAAWRSGHDTGASSKAIWAVMTGQQPERSAYPMDEDDLGRCLRLLELIPEWKPRLPEMAVVSPYWAALVENWPDLERLSKFTAPSPLRNRMKAILRPLEDADPNFIRLGGRLSGVTIRFGR
jgi:hypothetical protein